MRRRTSSSLITRRDFAGALALGALAAPFVARAQRRPFDEAETEMRWAGVPGASLARVSDGAIEARAVGLRDVARHQPVTLATVFEAASLSKPVFAYAVLGLVRAGTLDLDRPLDSYLAKPYPIDDPRAKRITARHVLSHTSGLPNWRPDSSTQLALAFEPGTRYQYSGEGFYFLQTVVETISGQSTAQFMRHTLDGLDMRASSYVWRDAYDANSASPYDQSLRPLRHDSAILGQRLLTMGKRQGKPLEAWRSSDALAALARINPKTPALPHDAMPNVAWSLLTTAPDYAKFVRVLLREPHSPMLKPVLRSSDYVWRGLGVALQKNGDDLAFFHTGSNPGFKAVMFGDVKRKRGVVSFTNSNGGFPFNMHFVEGTLGDQPAVMWLEEPQ